MTAEDLAKVFAGESLQEPFTPTIAHVQESVCFVSLDVLKEQLADRAVRLIKPSSTDCPKRSRRINQKPDQPAE